ncbi:hypothetical protein L7F22_009484 [Adiantum nelumboides]|nr:hypothetical protein [Adiantum nelumboides]
MRAIRNALENNIVAGRFKIGLHCCNRTQELVFNAATGPKKMVLLEAWRDYLLEDEKFEDAPAAFSSYSQLQKALAAYRADGLWQCVLAVAGMMEDTQEEVLRLANELCEELQALGRPGHATKIALEQCKELEDAVHLFIKAREWMEAMRELPTCVKSQIPCKNRFKLQHWSVLHYTLLSSKRAWKRLKSIWRGTLL